MIKKPAFLYLTLLLWPMAVHSAEVIISGADTTYARQKIEVYQYTDYISYQKSLLSTTMADDSGRFELRINLSEITEVLIPLGAYEGYFYAEPGKKYALQLPEFTPKTDADRLNPYFEATRLHVGFAGASFEEINQLVRVFEDQYIPYYNKFVVSSYGRKDFSTELQTTIESMEKTFGGYTDSFFVAFRHYRYGLLKFLANRQKSKSITSEYFSNQPVLYRHPAYMELFDQVFDKYLHFFANSPKGTVIMDDINVKKDVNALKKSLQANDAIQHPELLELVILNGLYDEFYDDNFSRQAMLEVLDGLIGQSVYTEIATIGKSMRQKVTRLMAGFAPPAFKLSDPQGKTVTLDDFKGKFVYLNFCSCQSYACMQEFEMMARLNDQLKGQLVMLSIIADEDAKALTDLLARRPYSWPFLLTANQPDITADYDIRAFPTYYLIGPDGKLALSPAPSPGEGLLTALFRLFKEYGIVVQ